MKIADILIFYGMPTVIVLVLGGSWLMRRAMRPVEILAAGAERIHAGNLAERIPRTGKDDELDRLADAFNAMLARVEAGTASARDFAIHASHELKTPLTILSAETELALGDPSIGAPERSRLLSQSEELHRLGRLVDALALAAKADAGMPVIARERLDFHQLVRQAVNDARVLGDPLGITMDLVLCDDAALDADPAGLRQVLLNLLDNAVKHNKPDGWVHIELAVIRRNHRIAVRAVPLVSPSRPVAPRGGLNRSGVRPKQSCACRPDPDVANHGPNGQRIEVLSGGRNGGCGERESKTAGAGGDKAAKIHANTGWNQCEDTAHHCSALGFIETPALTRRFHENGQRSPNRRGKRVKDDRGVLASTSQGV